ncbi:hypothetical protein ES332_A04G032400v1 [Gossypium tomentosum]|uniref:Uncharacterized protein n=1 Tax=Gossypium tomentosum TaxID=34277 RepID=A0A5D2QU09_GOSTO|nr:hypothetical protein ES332_A04G032400v1 [Gossypium tomentosum]
MSIQIVFFCNPIPLIIFNTVDAIVSPMIDCCGIEELGILYSFSSRSLVPVPLLNFHKLVEVKGNDLIDCDQIRLQAGRRKT